MGSSEPSANASYDEVPYESHPYPQSHPDRLATIATLLGMTPPPLDGCRVLELGCSMGGNIIPIAEQLPGSTCVGVDASSRQIADGQRTIESLALENVRLLHKDIMAIDEEFGEFDYIVCHGVFSWVPNQVQDQILRICSANLASNGVAYVSYNTYPGWRMRGMIRDVMLYRASFFDDPDQQLNEARALLDFLTESVPTKDNAYGILLRDEVNMLRGHSRSYLYHDHLEKVNDPQYFHEFVRRADEADLQYLGESVFSSMWANNFPRKVEETLKRLSSDVIQMEQYMDLVRNRMFRQTLLCHADVPINRAATAQAITKLFLASHAASDNPNANIRDRSSLTFRRPGSTLTTHEPIVKAAMFILREAWPMRLPFHDVLVAARERLRPGLVAVSAGEMEGEERTLANTMMRCYATSHVDLYAHQSVASLAVDDSPSTSRLARWQARAGNQITNFWHESVHAPDLERLLLGSLDGKHDRDALIDLLQREVAEQRLVVQHRGESVQGESVRSSLQSILTDNLNSLARKGLLRRQGS